MKKNNNISYSDYMGYINEIPRARCYDLIKCHEKLIGKFCEDKDGEKIDCGLGFIQEIFKKDYGLFSEFMHSQHLSNYFKMGIMELIIQRKPGYIIANAHKILDKGNLIDCSTDDELYDIFSLLRNIYVNGSSNYQKIEEIFEVIFYNFFPYGTKRPVELAKLLNRYRYREIIGVISDDGLKEVLSVIRGIYQKMVADYQSIDNIVNSIKNVLLAGAPDDEYVNRLNNMQLATREYLGLNSDSLAYLFSLLQEIYKDDSVQKENIDKIIESIISFLSSEKHDCDVKEAIDALNKGSINDLTIDEISHVSRQLDIMCCREAKTQEYVEFLTQSIKELLPRELACNDYPNILSILNSDKSFNDMSEEEIKTVYSVVADILINAKKSKVEISNIANNIGDYLFKLDGSGVTSFILNNTNRKDLATCLLNISGIKIDVNSYILGYGVDLEKLNPSNLYIIFEQLLKLNKDYAIEFVNMVMRMNILDVVGFIIAFNAFVVNDFRINESMILSSDSYKDIYSRTKETPLLLSEMFKFPVKEISLVLTNDIKKKFFDMIKFTMKEIDPDFVKKYYSPDGTFK